MHAQLGTCWRVPPGSAPGHPQSSSPWSHSPSTSPRRTAPGQAPAAAAARKCEGGCWTSASLLQLRPARLLLPQGEAYRWHLFGLKTWTWSCWPLGPRAKMRSGWLQLRERQWWTLKSQKQFQSSANCRRATVPNKSRHADNVNVDYCRIPGRCSSYVLTQ